MNGMLNWIPSGVFKHWQGNPKNSFKSGCVSQEIELELRDFQFFRRGH